MVRKLYALTLFVAGASMLIAAPRPDSLWMALGQIWIGGGVLLVAVPILAETSPRQHCWLRLRRHEPFGEWSAGPRLRHDFQRCEACGALTLRSRPHVPGTPVRPDGGAAS